MRPAVSILFGVAFFATGGVLGAEEFSGEAILIVYPEYPVNTDTFYGYARSVGHAGVLLVSDSGLTKYYEFGRYDEDGHGAARQVTVSNVELQNGRATESRLKTVLGELSKKSGRGGPIRAAYFINMDFDSMNKAANAKKNESDPTHAEYNKNRRKYDVTGYNCGHFAELVVLKGNPRVDRPTVINPTPNNIVDEYIEEGNAEVLYDPEQDRLTIGAGDESDAKR